VYLFWEATQPITASYKVSLRLLDPGGAPLVQVDGVPQAWTYPTTAWPPGARQSRIFTTSTGPQAAHCPLALVVYDEASGAPVGYAGGTGPVGRAGNAVSDVCIYNPDILIQGPHSCPFSTSRRSTFLSHSPEQSQRYGVRLGELCGPGDVFVFERDAWGRAKRRWRMASGAGLACVEPLTSPTFTLIKNTRAPATGRVLVHVDAYRLAEPREARSLGWSNILKSPYTVLIEWPERFTPLLPDERLSIHAAPDRGDQAQPADGSARAALRKTAGRFQAQRLWDQMTNAACD
jgi:tRNA threonylcarbamoyladenosine biosynthesis protein TsaE